MLISDPEARRIVSVENSSARVVDNGDLVAQPGAFAVSRDGSTAWIADGSDNAVVRMNLQSSVIERLPMDFAVTRFTALALDDTFLLATPGVETPGWVLAGAEQRNRTYFVPGIQ